MNQYIWYGLTQVITVVIAVGSVSLLERRRLRTSGNFERKQAHYADLFDVLFKVTKGLQQWHTNIFVSKDVHDLDAIQQELDSKDVLRLDALNQIWSSPKVIQTTETWIQHRKALAFALSSIQDLKELLTVEQRIEFKKDADAAKDAMVRSLNEVKDAVQQDLYLKGKWRSLITRLLP